MTSSNHRPGRLAVAAVATALLLAACGSDDDPVTPGETSDPSVPTSAADGDGTTDGTDDQTTSTTALLQPDPTKGTDPDRQAPPPGADEEATAELRNRLGVAKVVVRVGDTLVSDNGTDRFELPANYAEVHPAHLVMGTNILDDLGQPACPELELGDFGVIVEVGTSDAGSAVVTLEDRRSLVFDSGTGETAVERWTYDCGSGERTDLAPSASASWDGDIVFERRTSDTGPMLVTEWGLGDTPAVVTTADGIELVGFDDIAWDHQLSPDGSTLYFTSYVGTGAAEPPRAVTAVDTATGAERWTTELPGFVHLAGDRVIIEVVETSALNDLGWFDTTRLVVVDGATGAVLDELPFAGDLVGVG